MTPSDKSILATILDRQQAGHQQFRHLLDLHQPAFFLLLAVKRGDAGRV